VNTAPNYSRRQIGSLMMLSGTTVLSAAAAATQPKTPALSPARPARPPMDVRFDILDLLAEYSWCYDCQDAASYSSLFTEDGTLETVISATHGRENIAAFIPTLWAQHGEEIWQHHADQLLFFGAGPTYTVYSYWSVLKGKGSNHDVMGFGYYVSHCVKLGDRWLLHKRSIHPWSPTKLPWASIP